MSVALGMIAILRSGWATGDTGAERGAAAVVAVVALVVEMAAAEEHLPAFLIQLVAESQGTLLARSNRSKPRGIEVFVSPLKSQSNQY